MYFSLLKIVVSEGDEDKKYNFELHLHSGRPVGSDKFEETLERSEGRSLRPGKGGWPRGKKRK